MSLQERDKKHLWHPLTQHKSHPSTIVIKKAKGAVLYGEDGHEMIDGIASWYTCMYGHSHPYIVEKITTQLQQLDHVVFTGFTHEPAIKLSEALISILPDNQEKIFFSDNGSTAVDVALKMAFQYHYNQGKKKKVIIALDDGFHGDTFGAMSVSGLSVYNGSFEDFFLDVKRIPVPTDANIDEVKTQLEKIIATNDVAAFVYEPLVQGAAGMKIFKAEHLNQLLTITKNNQVINIADEVMTGFGKTGTHFASEQLPIKPDIICLSKSLTAGVAPMAITTCTQDIYNAFYDDDITKGFFHGHTYSANPLTCTAALAGIDLLISDEMQANIQRISSKHEAFENRIKDHPKVKSTRQLGVIFALDLDLKLERYGNIRDKMFNYFMENGVCLRPLGNVIYILPPFIISDAQLDKIYTTIEEGLEHF